MLWFIIGLLLGGMLGMAVMALCNAAKSTDNDRKSLFLAKRLSFCHWI